MILRKLPDWRERLDAYIQSIRAVPFDWKTHNCAGFVSQCIAAQCGVDPWADMRARYAELENDVDVRLQLAREFGTLENAVDSCLRVYGFKRTPCASAGSPVVTVLDSGRCGAGVSLGRYTAALTEKGLIMSTRFRHLDSWGWP